jgi:serine/threonine protein kinase
MQAQARAEYRRVAGIIAKTFVRCLMNVNPHVRPSSREALQHPVSPVRIIWARIANTDILYLLLLSQWLSTRRPSVTKRIPIPTTGNTVEIEIHHSPSSPEDQFGRTPVEPITTLKPDHPVARQITALGYQELS